MEFVVHNHSSYPRAGETEAAQRLRRAHTAWECGDITAADLEAAERVEMTAIVREQIEAGADVVTDGQVRWDDPVSGVMRAFDGVRLDGLRRYFDTNFYVRQPVVTGRVRRRGPIAVGDFRQASAVSQRPVKVALPGPYTLARLSVLDNATYDGVPALAAALSEGLAAEMADLAAAGATLVQIEEPAILAHPGDIRLLRELLEPLWAARGAAQLVVATYFADAEPLYAQLNSLPADVLALDLSSSPHLLATIAATGASKTLALGLVNGRTARVEHPADIARQVETALHRYTLDAVHLMPSCGLEHVPRATARAKLHALAAARRLLAATL
jgi:5-methyltetrahydropteroyltriglutamate--homocysteine methyltransferase